MRSPRPLSTVARGGSASADVGPAANGADAAPPGAIQPLLAAVPLGLAVVVFLVWAARDGGYAAVHWLPGALFVVGLALVAVLAEGRPFGGRRELAVAAALLAAYTIWSFLSIAWADVKGDAWDGANRTLLYLCVFVLFAWRSVPARVAGLLLGALAVGTAAIGAVDFLRAVDAARPADFFIAGRLASPISYPNANAALLLAAFVPSVFLASRREVPVVVRAVMLAAAGVLLELAIMSQSRASLGALPLVILGFLALSPGRLRFLLAFGIVALPAALGTRTLLDVYPAIADEVGVRPALVDARAVLAWSAVALLLVGAAVALADRAVRIPQRVTRAVGFATAVASAAAVVVVPAVLVARYGDPVDRASSAWREFKSAKSTPSASHLTSGLSSPRYDLWRVALKEFEQSPLQGVGTENFAVDYLRLRRTNDEPVHQHSLELRVLAQTGLVGAVLFGGFLVAALLAAGRVLRRRRAAAGVAAAALAIFAYWAIHGSVDWFWEVPALGAPAFAALALAAQVDADGAARPRRGSVAWSAVPAVLVAAVAAASLTLPWLAAKQVDAAAATWPQDPSGAFQRLDRARRLNPLSDRADLVAGVIASRLHDRRRERAAFDRVLVRNPYNWYARFQLAVLDAQEGRKRAALRRLAEARSLNPREPMIELVREKVVEGERISQAELDQLFIDRSATLTGARQR